MNGEIVLTETDIGSTGFGLGWSHTRAYNNQLRSFMDRGNGYLWWPENWPFVTTSMYPIASLAVITNSHDIMWFTGSAPSYTILFGRREQLTHDVTAAEYRLLYPDGTVTVLNDLTHPTRPGAFKQMIAPGGMVTSVTPVGANILEVTREFNGTTESFLYSFNSDDRVEDITLRRQTGTGPWQYISKAIYEYYTGSDAYGSEGDLKRVERLRWEDASSNWVHLNYSYYRYYKDGDANGFAHGLKYVLGPSAYQQMVDAGQDPLTDPVGAFADNFFEYDADQRVTTEITNAGSTSYQMSYYDNSDAPDQGEQNHWFRKTTWTYPNDDKRIVFTNIHGAAMLEVFQSGADSSRQWYWFKEYNDYGQVTLEAQPSAITGYDESLNDLVGKISAGNYTYLRASDGLIRTYTYQGTSGYQAVMTQAAVKQGTGSAHPAIPIREWTYISNTAGGDTINLVASEKVYPVAGGSADVTSYSYSFYTNSNQYQSKQTTWPAVGTSQNGSGSANSMTEYFNQQGYRTSVTNENSVQTAFQYDIVTGAMTRRTDDVGGLALVTDYEFDDQGRTTQALGPVHTIDISGTATSIRQATWTVYDDPNFTVRVGRGYVSGNWSSSSSSVPSSGSSGSSETSGGSSDSSGTSGGSSGSSAGSGGSSGSGGSTSSGSQPSFPSYFSFPSSSQPSMPSTPSLSMSSSSQSSSSRSSSSSGSSSGSSGSGGSSSSRSSSSLSSGASEDSSGSSTTSGGSSGSSVPSGSSGSSGSGSSSFETLVNPVRISIYDAGGKLLEEISATRAWTNGKLLPSDTFAQSSYVRWTTNQYLDCCLVESTRVYHDIPSSGAGSAGANYTETDFGYDVNKRQNRVKSPGGTITFTELDGLGRRTAVYIGTDDSGGAGDNMVLVASYEYDNGNANSDSNLTTMTQHVDGSSGNDRVTTYEYDWRDRQTKRTLPLSLYETITYDNLDRPTVTEQFEQGTSPAVRAGKQTTSYDSLGRVYLRETYGVSSSGTIGNAVKDDTWYDAIGNVAITRAAGSNLLSMTEYDALNRPEMRYLGSSSSTSYSDLMNVANYTVLQQSQMSYDEASNLIGTFSKQRYHDTTGAGALQDPSTAPKARLGYTASWPDGIGRQQAVADYGTNGSPGSRPTTIPSSSDTLLVTRMTYDNASRVQDTTDPLGTVTRQEYDGRDRVVRVTENYSVSGGRVTSTTYAADGGIATLTAENSTTGNQVTTYTYGTTLTDSGIATSQLLRQVTYPDSSTDNVTYAYNRQAERTNLTDQNGTVHTYEYDKLGRLLHDRVVTLGTGVDGAVLRISFAYHVRGMVLTITSYDNASVGSGTIVNQVIQTYNDFNQVASSEQQH